VPPKELRSRLRSAAWAFSSPAGISISTSCHGGEGEQRHEHRSQIADVALERFEIEDQTRRLNFILGHDSGGGTGSYYFESCSGVYNELQCGSYAFMDADYGRILDKNGKRIDKGEWENALFILTSVMSHAKPDKARCPQS
jgi:3-hydroxy-D-aspartate aldolase